MRKDKFISLKWSFFLYLPVTFVLALAGVMAIGHTTNYIQDLYTEKYSIADSISETSEIAVFVDELGTPVIGRLEKRRVFDGRHEKIYFLLSNAQVILCPLWVVFSVGFMGVIFFNRELREPIEILMSASRNISENKLDFEVYYYKKNELGTLCKAFNDMRSALFENNREMWHMLEERRRVNSAFSHDLRTPLTVLRGYGEFLEKYGGEEKISEEKQREILGKMLGQISRLENYTAQMSSISKLEEITPEYRKVKISEFSEQLRRSGEIICKGKTFAADFPCRDGVVVGYINIDSEIAMRVYENILGNAARFAKEKITARLEISEDNIILSVEDDGNGFSEEGLKNAKKPFYRGDASGSAAGENHLGLGLYICSVLCGKCGGALYAENCEGGARVTAEFSAG